MLDVTDQDIADLNDADLRALVARLIEATLRKHGLSTAGVTWGGSQDAPDGGIDVRVELGSDVTVSGFVPRPLTGFQIKKPDMGPAAIRTEMRSRGTLRESIADLADRGGAYVIVSSGSHLADSALLSRRDAMRNALAEHPHGGRLAVDFYDRQRLATWVRDFPALVPWVLARAGRPMQGWRSYENWASAGSGQPAEFLIDDAARLFDGTGQRGRLENGMAVLDGLQRMRTSLARPGASARLIGLSGVGKTRLVAALFDSGIGTDALDPAIAVYTDLGAHPEPSPTTVATHLLQRCSSAVLIVDNCPQELHRQLTELCRSPNSLVRILTIEYDIRDDSPEGTEVFRLEVASAELVAKVVRAHCPSISQVDAETIGVFSGGNSRVGLALAHTVQYGETLSGLSDEALFERLFRQRHTDDVGLLAAGEACALVYSFDGETVDGEDSELVRLAALAGCSVSSLYRHLAELSRRGLLQQRGQWRAILPQAIADRLARRALENIPRSSLDKELVSAPGRLMKSFARRLGYLHDSRIAVGIVHDWLAESGVLGPHIGDLSPHGMAILVNVAPAAPESALSATERVAASDSDGVFFSRHNLHRDEFVRLLHKIAYDAELFERCAALLIEFALAAERPEKGHDAAREAWQSLFQLLLSGTRATITQRLRVIEELLRGDNSDGHQLGVEALTAALQTSQFHSIHEFSFGSRLRDYGYRPATPTEQAAWYSACLSTVLKLGLSSIASAARVRKGFADQLPGLWLHTSIQDEIEATIKAFTTQEFWEDGWLAVREAMWRCRRYPTGAALTRLQTLEEELGPRTLGEKIGVYVLRDRGWMSGLENATDEIADARDRAEAQAEGYGRLLARQERLLDELLPAMLGNESGLRWHLGRGLAQAADDRLGLWSRLAVGAAEVGNDANLLPLRGYLSAWGELDLSAVREILENAAGDPLLIRWFPHLEAAVRSGGFSVDRLHRALINGAPAWAFRILAFGRLTDEITTSDLRSLLSAIVAAPDGWDVSVEILAMRLRSERGDRSNLDLLFELGCDLLLGIDPSRQSHRRLDFALGALARACLSGERGHSEAAAVCRALADAFERHAASFYDFNELVREIFRAQPEAALDVFLRRRNDSWHPTVLSMFDDVSGHLPHPVADIEDEIIMNWCIKEPDQNFVAAATSIPYSRKSTSDTEVAWTELALRLLEKSPEPSEVLKTFAARFSPHAWSGSRAALIESNAELLLVQESSENPSLARTARHERKRLLEEAERERRRESDSSRRENERFE